ncbi:MAG: GMC family oxidoreductase [Bacteroidia bacterium]
MDYDYVIVGSGFGGSVSALRLSEKGYKVLVIEKGKWRKSNEFAKTNWDLKRWLWIPFIKCFGIMKITITRHITILSGVGVGGGSLVYANTLPVPKSAFYTSGSWAKLNNWEQELRPFYKLALEMLGATKNPKLFDSDKALLAVAKEMGRQNDFKPTNVAVYFGKPNETVTDPYFNGKGPDRTGCNFCGACMTGCPNNSKNTLDKNYLHLAQQLGAKILAEKEVVDVKPIDEKNGTSGYIIRYNSSTKLYKQTKEIRAKGVIFSGGVLGTLKLLFKLKPTSLPKISNRLGHDIRTNNETLISVSSLDAKINTTKGVAIGSILETDKNSHLEIVRYGKGSGAWKLTHLPYSASKNHLVRYINIIGTFIKSPLSYFKIYIKNSWSKKTAVLLFMQTLDSTLTFKKGWFGNISAKMGSGKKPTPFIPESIRLTHAFAKKLKGKPSSFVGEALLGIPSTAHILGGAVMSNSSETGVIDKNNQVFNYKNMFIIDGSMISSNPGVNPSLSITAIAEHAMSKIPKKEQL